MAQRPDLPYINSRIAYQYLGGDSNYAPLLTDTLGALVVVGSGSEGPMQTALNWRLQRGAPPLKIFYLAEGGNFGGNIVWGTSETEMARELAQGFGLADDMLYIPPEEKRITNTLAEARGIRELVETATELPMQDVLLFTYGPHTRRAWATFVKQNPGVAFWAISDMSPLTVEMLPRLVQECDRLREYGAKGDLLLQQIPDDVAGVVEELRTHLQMPIPVAIMETIHYVRQRLGMAPHHLNTP